jgi:hypothetical protein
MKIFIPIILIGLLLSCNKFAKRNDANGSIQDLSNPISLGNIEPIEQIYGLYFLKNNGDLIEIPFFEIELELSETAEKKLLDDNESVIIVAYFTSDLDDANKLPEKYKNKVVRNTITIITHTIELTNTRLARFENLVFPKEIYDLLEDKDIDVLINVYSGRRSINTNMLYCAILSGPISKIKNGKFTLNGGLIGERSIKINNINFDKT